MMGCLDALDEFSHVNMIKFSMCPPPPSYSQSLCTHFHDHTGFTPSVNVSLSPHNALSNFELLETKGYITIMPVNSLGALQIP